MTNGSSLQAQNDTDEISGRFFIVLLLVVTLGFAAHRLRPMIQSRGAAWAELISYTTGGLMIIAVFPMIYSMIIGSVGSGAITRRSAVFLGFLGLVVSFGAVGAGVALGWVVDPEFGLLDGGDEHEQ